MSTRFMHIIFSGPRDESHRELPGEVNPVETISQFVLLSLVILLCFYQPPFLVDLINQSFLLLPE